MQQVILQVKRAWEKGQSSFQEELDRAKGDQESMEYFAMIDFAADGYAYTSTSRAYLDNPARWDRAINGYMLAWRVQFLTDDLDPPD